MNQTTTLHYEANASEGLFNIGGLFEGLRNFSHKFAYVLRRSLAKSRTAYVPAYHVVNRPDYVSEYILKSGAIWFN